MQLAFQWTNNMDNSHEQSRIAMEKNTHIFVKCAFWFICGRNQSHQDYIPIDILPSGSWIYRRTLCICFRLTFSGIFSLFLSVCRTILMIACKTRIGQINVRFIRNGWSQCCLFRHFKWIPDLSLCFVGHFFCSVVWHHISTLIRKGRNKIAHVISMKGAQLWAANAETLFIPLKISDGICNDYPAGWIIALCKNQIQTTVYLAISVRCRLHLDVIFFSISKIIIIAIDLRSLMQIFFAWIKFDIVLMKTMLNHQM